MSDESKQVDKSRLQEAAASLPPVKTDSASVVRMWLSGAAWLLLTVAAVLGYWVYLRWMWYGWFPAWDQWSAGLWTRLTEGESYYTHGPLIPVVCIGVFYLLVQKTRIEIRPNPWWGLAIVLFGQAMYLLVSYEKIRFVLGGFGLITLCGVVTMIWGLRALRRFWFVPVFSLFAMPMGDTLFAGVSFTLRMLATDMAVFLTNFLGVICDRMDNTIVLTGGKELIVGDVCSGLRTLISLLAFGTIYVYICRLRGWLRWLLFSAIVPVGLICNSIRIAAIIIVANYGSVEFAAGEFHDSTGILIFVMAFLIMFGLEKFILWTAKSVGKPVKVIPLMSDCRLDENEKPAWRALYMAALSRWMAVAIVIMAVTSTMGWRLARRPLTSWDQSVVNAAAPEKIEINNEIYHSRALQLDQQVLRILNTSDYFYRQYRYAGRMPISVLVVYSQDNRVSTHAPEVCITAAGGKIVAQKTVDVQIPSLGTVACRALMVAEGDFYHCYLYSLRAGGSYTSSIWKQQALISLNGIVGRDASGALIRISMPSMDNDFESSMALLQQAMAQTLPPLDSVMDNGGESSPGIE